MSAVSACVIDIALFPRASAFLGQQPVVVVKRPATNRFTRANIPQVAFFGVPTGFFRFRLGNVIGGQLLVKMQIERHMVFVGVGAVFGNGNPRRTCLQAARRRRTRNPVGTTASACSPSSSPGATAPKGAPGQQRQAKYQQKRHKGRQKRLPLLKHRLRKCVERMSRARHVTRFPPQPHRPEPAPAPSSCHYATSHR